MNTSNESPALKQFQPQDHLTRSAHVAGRAAYDALVAEAEADYEGDWARLLCSVAKGEAITQDVSTLENPAILDQLSEAH